MERSPHGPDVYFDVLERTLAVARRDDYEGYSKHDALNAPWLERLAGESRLRRLLAIQTVMRSPVHVRPLLHVRKARNPKGLALFARALLARYRLLGNESDALEARALLDHLLAHPDRTYGGTGWGYPYPWQDVGFFAPRDLPNRVVTSVVAHALLDAHETLGDVRFLEGAVEAVRFLFDAPATLFEDADRRCVSYVPDPAARWIVLDVSALAGAVGARLASITGDARMMTEAGRLVRYVASKQTPEGAWFYAEPPDASRVKHDNYHTGFIVDAILQYGDASKSDEFEDVYAKGIAFYEERLFEPDGAPRFMSDRRYPYDIHGAAQGVITFSLQQRLRCAGLVTAQRVLDWTIDNMWEPDTGWFSYQKRRAIRTKIRELRWCQGWMSWALASYLETTGLEASA
jgi:hypothetical protein